MHRRVALGALVGCVCVAATGCGSSTSSTSATTSASAQGAGNTSSSAGDASTAVQAAVQRYSGPSTFTAPGPPLKISGIKGKTIYLIPETSNPFINSIDATIQSVGKQLGLNVVLYPNQGLQSQWVQGFNTAVAAKAALIASNGTDPRELQPQLAAAKAARIPVVSIHLNDNSEPPAPNCAGCAAGVTATVPGPFNLAGKVAADWMINDSHGKANVLVVGAADVPVSPPTVAVMKHEFATECSHCTFHYANVPVADWGTKVTPTVSSALTGDPSINYVYVQYDAMVAGAVPAVLAAGRANSVKVVSYNGSPYALKYIQEHNVVAMDVGEDSVGIGYASMDQILRLLLHQSPVAERTPIRIWDASNVSQAGNPPQAGEGYGSAYKVGFTKLWGLG